MWALNILKKNLKMLSASILRRQQEYTNYANNCYDPPITEE